MNNNIKVKGLVLRNGEKNLRDNVPIRFNDWAVIGGPKKDTADITKTALIKFSVLTHNHGVGGKTNIRDCSVGTKSSLKLDRLEDNPKAVVETWQSIFNELLPAMIDVDPITAVELFEAHLTGSAAKEFQQIVYQVSDDLFDKYIEVEFNMRICRFRQPEKTNAELDDDQRKKLPGDQRVKAVELKRWLDKNETRKTARTGVLGIREYKYSFPPEKFPRPPARPSKGKFTTWSISGINALNANAWLRQHNHGWEFGEKYLNMVFKEVQKLAFNTFGAHAGRTQLDYLTEDLRMDPTHSMKQFFRLLTAHSEAQPYYPPVAMDSEVAVPFNEDRKIHIVWNAGFDVYKEELTTLGLSRREDLKSNFETCKDKFLLAEQHRNAKEAKSSVPKKPTQGGGKNPGGKKGGGSDGKHQGGNGKFYGKCSFCGKQGHHSSTCFKNPKSNSFVKPKTKPEFQTKKRKVGSGGKSSYEEWKNKKEYEQYCQEIGSDAEEGFVEG